VGGPNVGCIGREQLWSLGATGSRWGGKGECRQAGGD